MTFKKALNLSVLVVALGYFVDIFDLTLFNMVRKSSLISLGVPTSEQVDTGLMLLNAQMVGMLLGGILWGVLGDKKGRLSVLFASIVMYSLANIANAFVSTVPTYMALRFIAGVGLAGELGVGITLVSEILPKELRGYGTTIVATIGVLGAVAGGYLVEHFTWSTCYIIGGVLGLLLLLLRVKVHESGMFAKIEREQNISRGNFFKLFSNRDRFSRFLFCILIGVPIWFIAGIVMPLAPEIGPLLGVTEPLTSARAIGISYLGLAVGDFASGLFSQKMGSRRIAVQVFQIFCLCALAILFSSARGQASDYYYFICFFVGVGAGFWAIFVTVAAEQFGTNLRATAATSIPNFVRGSVVPMSFAVTNLKSSMGLLSAIISVGVVVFVVAFASSFRLRETFGKDLNYLENL